MKTLTFLLALATSVCLSTPAMALDKPSASDKDKRVLFTDYKTGEVYPINAANGLITTIVFAPGEKVLSYGSGYSTAWEFAARGNHFFLKPKDKQGTTNLVVVTDHHTYLFEVRLGLRKKATFSLTFAYPEEAAKLAEQQAEQNRVKDLMNEEGQTGQTQKTDATVASINRNYTENFGSSRNSVRIAPLEVYDNGQFTYLKFDKQVDFPSVYRVEEGDTETLLNAHVQGDWLVVHGVYEELRLRAGLAVVGIYNEAFEGGGVANHTGVTVPGVEREFIQGER